MLPRMKTSFSKFWLVKLDLFGLKMSPAELNSLSTAAELGRGVLYFRNSLTQTFL